MEELEGVNGFWLDVPKLESARSQIIAELGAKEGMFMFGVWVRLFTWQYQTGRPITGPEHIRNLTGLHGNQARYIWRSIPRLLPRSVVRSDHGLVCRKTMGILKKHSKNKVVSENQNAGPPGGDSDSDSYSSLTSSVLLSSEVKQPSESKTTKGGVGGKRDKPAPPAEPATVDGLDEQAWGDYVKHRTAIRARKLKPASVERLQRWLVEQPDQAAVIDQTIRNGWTGLFELKVNGSNQTTLRKDPDFQRWLNGEDEPTGDIYEGSYEKH